MYNIKYKIKLSKQKSSFVKARNCKKKIIINVIKIKLLFNSLHSW